MDDVIYKDKSCFVNNANSSNNGETVYDILENELNANGTRNSYLVSKNKFKRVKSLKNLKNDLFGHYEWYMMYHYDNELNSKFYTKK